MKEKNSYRKLFTKHLSYWFLTVFIIHIFSRNTSLTERFYARTLYPVVAVVNRWLAQWFPFSIGDLLYFWGISYLLYQIIQLFIQIKKPKNQLEKISVFLLKTIWIFYLSWGFNYFRQPLSNRLNLSLKKYDMSMLLQVTDSLIARSNRLQIILSDNDSTAVVIPYGLEHILQKAPKGYQTIQSITRLNYRVPCIKPSLFSKQISYMGVSGYLNPFTGEAQINRLYPKVFLPDIVSHEIAHQLGYAPENEANFLGYLAATHHPDPYFNYSGNINALYYFLIELKKADPELFKKYLKKINKGILKNFREANEFSKKYRFPINFSSGYDAYLKLNKQKSGIRSYNEMVRLVIAYELKDQL